MTLDEAVREEIKKHKEIRAFPFFWNDKKLWVKQPSLGEKNIWHSLLWLLSKVTKNSLFIPTVVTNPKESLAYEVKRLKELKEQGVNVPELFLDDENFLVVEDSGGSIIDYLQNKELGVDIKKEIAQDMSKQMAKMHNCGIYHSRPALRDITYKDGKVYFIDFEENLENSLTNKEAITRDSIIFIHSIFRSIKDEKIREIALKTYKDKLSPQIQEEIRDTVSKYTKLLTISKPFKRYFGKDAVAISNTIKYLTKSDD